MSSRYIDYSGKVLDNRYRVIKLLAIGGMGSIYLGEHILIGRRVAVKLLNRKFTRKKDIVMRFFREAQAAAAIRHKNIIDIWDTGTSKQGDPYLVMEYLEGESLSDMLKRNGPIDLPAACAVLEPVLSALDAAHEKGIVHRDLKPDNIFLSWPPGETLPLIKLIDFGVSKLAATRQPKVTVAGTQFGTPAYMAPEQIRGEASLDHRADLYSVGVVLFEMLTGKLPFEGADKVAVFANALTKDPLPLKEAYNEAPGEVSSVVLRLLRKAPEARFPSAASLLDEVKAFSGYDKRLEHLSRYTCANVEAGVRSRDIVTTQSGEFYSVEDSDTSPSTYPRTTPTGWITASSQPPEKKRRMGTVGAIAGFAGIMIALGFAWRPFGQTKMPAKNHLSAPNPAARISPPIETDSKKALMYAASASDSTPSPSPAVFETVQLEIKGAPEGAAIFFDDRLYETTPFSVRKSETPAVLKVVAESYKNYEENVTADKDVLIYVHLQPLVRSDAKRTMHSKISQRKQKQTDPSPRSTDPVKRNIWEEIETDF